MRTPGGGSPIAGAPRPSRHRRLPPIRFFHTAAGWHLGAPQGGTSRTRIPMASSDDIELRSRPQKREVPEPARQRRSRVQKRYTDAYRKGVFPALALLTQMTEQKEN